MGFFSTLFCRRENTKTDRLAVLTQRLDAFMRPSLVLTDPRALNIPEKRQRYALFAYGAITILAEREELDETHILAALVRFLGSASRMHARETSRLVNICASGLQTEEDRSAVSAGAGAMQEWLTGDTRAAVSRLTQSLSS